MTGRREEEREELGEQATVSVWSWEMRMECRMDVGEAEGCGQWAVEEPGVESISLRGETKSRSGMGVPSM